MKLYLANLGKVYFISYLLCLETIAGPYFLKSDAGNTNHSEELDSLKNHIYYTHTPLIQLHTLHTIPVDFFPI